MLENLTAGFDKRWARVSPGISNGVSSIEGSMDKVAKDAVKAGDKILK